MKSTVIPVMFTLAVAAVLVSVSPSFVPPGRAWANRDVEGNRQPPSIPTPWDDGRSVPKALAEILQRLDRIEKRLDEMDQTLRALPLPAKPKDVARNLLDGAIR